MRESALELSDKYIRHYIDNFVGSYEEFQNRIITRIDNYGAYQFLRHKSSEEILRYGIKEFQCLFKSLYSTQRQRIYNDLEIILTSESGLQYFRGFINRILKRNFIDIDELHMGEREQIRNYSKLTGSWKLGFGKNTMSQIAHFCKPDKYPLSNTKSQATIYEFYNSDVSDNYYEFTKYANLIVEQLRTHVEEKLNLDIELIFREHKYVLLDDFVEFVYALLQQ